MRLAAAARQGNQSPEAKREPGSAPIALPFDSERLQAYSITDVALAFGLESSQLRPRASRASPRPS